MYKSWKLPLWMIAGAFAISAGVCSAQELRDPTTNVTFPSEVSFDYQGKKHNLKATGVSTRKKLFVKVYSVASYIEDPAKLKNGDVFENILNSKNAKQLNLIFVRNVDQKKVQDGYRESLNKVIPQGQLKPEVDQYLSWFGNVNAKDTHVIRWLPDGSVTVLINGTEKGTIKNPEFGRALLNLWFGKNAVVKRDLLVSEIR